MSVPLSPRSQAKLMTNIYRKITNGVVNLRALEPAWLTDLFITHCDLYIENRHSQTEGTWIIFYSMTPEHRNGNETQLWSGNMCFWNLKPRAEADSFSVPYNNCGSHRTLETVLGVPERQVPTKAPFLVCCVWLMGEQSSTGSWSDQEQQRKEESCVFPKNTRFEKPRGNHRDSCHIICLLWVK